MSRFLNEKFKSLEAYTPGEQPKDMKYIKLNTNESPFPPSKGVVDAISADEVGKLRLYPDPEGSELKSALAELYGVKKENVFLSNGSDEILNFSFMAFFDKKGVVFPSISYGFYKVYADLYGLNYEQIPLCEDFSINYKDYVGVEKNVVIANPNAPTGMTLTLSEVEEIVKSNSDNIVLIDEAYVDFGGESCVGLTKKYDNLLVCCTYSKSRSLAGARLGFAIGNSEIIADLEKIKYSTNPYNINRLTMTAGLAAVRDNDYYMNNCRIIEENREFTKVELEGLGFRVLPSKANFIFAESDDIDGGTLYSDLRQRGILVRHFTSERIKNFNRITIGTLDDMKALVSAVSDILKSKGELK
ncbi:MAG: histidinol-phosphate transaminase [Clostridia bacterium]|nr:histidinol-phosphate transaminase [Clostridia bacterium]